MTSFPSCLLPDPDLLQFDALSVESDHQAILLLLSSIAPTAVCPICSTTTGRIHSRYQRRMSDLAWADFSVRIVLGVRRFFCDSPDCPRRIFTERLPSIVAPWARRTTRLASVYHQLGLIAGGVGGAALSTLLGCPIGIDGLLDLLRHSAPDPRPTPRVLGVDDWALRKGQRYATILIDHERGQVIDLLPDRTPQTLAQWLRDHPGVEIVTRDRSEAYAQAITQGAPDALQIADRFHLFKNLTDALTTVLQNHRAAIVQHLSHSRGQQRAPESPYSPSADGEYETQTNAPTAADQRRQRRAEEIQQLHERGWSNKRIAEHVQCHPKTVQRALQRDLPLPIGRAGRYRKLDAYGSYLLKRWNEGCHTASQVYREIQGQGYDGGCTIVRVFVAELRKKSGMPARSRTADSSPLPSLPKRVPSSRTLAWISTQPVAELDDQQRAYREALPTINATLAMAIQVAQTFATMLRERQAASLDAWLDDALQCGIMFLRSFASGIRADYAAVRAAFNEVWSNGRTEGCVNRLKSVKRQMYGRGKLDLLRLRVMA